MAQCPFLGLYVHGILCGLGAVVELVLLHRQLRVAQHVLLLGELALSIEDFEVEVGVAQLDDDVALVHLRTLVDNLLYDHAALFG